MSHEQVCEEHFIRRKVFITKLLILCCPAKANNTDFVLCVSMVLGHDSVNDDEG